MESIFLELTFVLVIAGILSYLVNFLKQPSIIAYIVAGLIIGPLGVFNLQQTEIFNGLAQIGITLLLFMVGLELDFNQAKKLGRTILIAGFFQILVTFCLSFGVFHILGNDLPASMLMAIALTFSSTIIIVKLLSEKRDLESLYGKIAIGILLLQDIVAIFLLIALGSAGSNDLQNILLPWQKLIFTLVKALSIALAVGYMSKVVWPKILRRVGKSDELLLVTTLAWALGLAAFVSLPFIGFGVEIGGFIAGLALANSAVHYQIGSRIKSIRDFFLIIFFIVLGSQFTFANTGNILLPALLLSALVLIGKPFIVMSILGLLGYKPKTGYAAGTSLSQISEFGLVLMPIGLKLGILSSSQASTVTLVAIISIGVSSYFIQYSNKIYSKMQRLLAFFDFRNGEAEKHMKNLNLSGHLVILGGNRLGHHIVESLIKLKKDFILVDFNPDIVEKFKRRDVAAICGDITDPHIQDLCCLAKAKVIISTIADRQDSLQVLDSLRKSNARAKIILTAKDEPEALDLYKKNANYVILPHFIGGLHIADLLGEDLTLGDLPKLKKEHLAILKSLV